MAFVHQTLVCGAVVAIAATYITEWWAEAENPWSERNKFIL